MSKLSSNFDLHYDLKHLDQLNTFIGQYNDPRFIMRLMFNEIELRDKIISDHKEKDIELQWFRMKYPHPYPNELKGLKNEI